jgi:tetratricopeptide (TPR) repeat protein
MRTRFRLGISVICGVMAAAPAAFAQGAITVVGGGLGEACFEAAENGRIPSARALEVCDLALEQERLNRRDRAATLTNRGILHMRAGNNTRALWDYQKSLNIMPELKEARVNLGAALYNLKRYPEALAALNEGVGSESLNARSIGHYNRGLTHEKLGDLQSAYEDFRMALQLDPEFAMAAQQMARFTVVPAGT